ncbi:MAG: alpha-rhamnosidase, partial [Clostridia bacterium]|nr:alpha-rhamnosidase [Clostridia bacterium]
MNKPKWMWKYGEFEIYHNMLVHTRREELGIEYPTMWQISGICPWVEFSTNVDTDKPGYINAKISGIGFVSVDGKRYNCDENVTIPAGKHKVNIRVMNTSGLPCAYAESDVCPSGEGWYTVISMNVDQNHHQSLPVGCTPAYYNREDNPEIFAFEYKTFEPESVEQVEGGMLYDFGKETFGKLHIDGTNGKEIGVYFGESTEEALDTDHTYIRMHVGGCDNHCLRSVAFRYVYIKSDDAANYKVYYDYEYLTIKQLGSFTSNDERINKIWDTSAYTFQLNSREFYFDGIKRDRWVWSGDAYQSYMVNNYLNSDSEIAKRTIIALRGKDPVEQHINTITDYSFYWIISVMNYYSYYGDKEFVKLMFPKMQSLMQFCESRKNSDGFVDYADGDWIFVDWSDMDKTGAICAEQILFYQAYRALADAAKLLGLPCEAYENEAKLLKDNINKFYWD